MHALHKRGLHAVVFVCLSVRLVSVTFVYSVRMSKHILKLFSPSGFRRKRYSNILTATLTGVSNAGV